jgi:hypothetical protein
VLEYRAHALVLTLEELSARMVPCEVHVYPSCQWRLRRLENISVESKCDGADVSDDCDVIGGETALSDMEGYVCNKTRYCAAILRFFG